MYTHTYTYIPRAPYLVHQLLLGQQVGEPRSAHSPLAHKPPQLRFIHIHQLVRIQYTLVELDTVNIYWWWWCINLCRVKPALRTASERYEVRERGEVFLRGVGTLRYLFPPNASVLWQPRGLTIHTKTWFLGAGCLGAPPISLMKTNLWPNTRTRRRWCTRCAASFPMSDMLRSAVSCYNVYNTLCW